MSITRTLRIYAAIIAWLTAIALVGTYAGALLVPLALAAQLHADDLGRQQ